MEEKKKKGKKILLIILCILLSLCLALAAAFFAVFTLGKNQFHGGDTDISVNSEQDIVIDEGVVSYKGKDYVLNKDIVSVLFIGIDKSDVNADLGYGKNGQADSLFVAAIDTKTGKVTAIPISRETMVDVDLYSVDGGFAGVKNEQLCLAYAYGSDPDSCSKNVMRSVRRLLFGINISSYVTVDMEGVKKLTDAVGGVEVESLENINLNGKTVNKGQSVLLDGKTVDRYVRYRDADADANNRRMLRQKQCLTALVSKAGNQVLGDVTKLKAFYDVLTPYLATDLSFSQITYLASSCLKADMGSAIEFKAIKGVSADGEKWAEFTPDTESVLETVMDVFYIER